MFKKIQVQKEKLRTLNNYCMVYGTDPNKGENRWVWEDKHANPPFTQCHYVRDHGGTWVS